MQFSFGRSNNSTTALAVFAVLLSLILWSSDSIVYAQPGQLSAPPSVVDHNAAAPNKKENPSWKVSSDAGEEALKTKDYPLAIEKFKDAVQKCEQVEPDSLHLMKCLINLNRAYKILNRYSDSEPIMERAVAIAERKLPPKSSELASCLNFQALVYSGQNRYSLAIPLFERAIHILDGLDDGSADSRATLAGCLCNLGEVYKNQTLWDKAVPLFKRGAALSTKLWGETSEGTQRCQSYLAMSYMDLGCFDESKAILNHQTVLAEKQYGKDALNAVEGLVGLVGTIELLSREPAAAERSIKRALRIRESHNVGNDKMSGVYLQTLGSTYRVEGKFQAAEPLFKRSIKINEKVGGQGLIKSLNSLGTIYLDEKRFAEAEPLFKRALDKKEPRFGVTLGEANTLSGLAIINLHKKNFSEAESLQKSALKMLQQKAGPDSQAALIALDNLASIQRQAGKSSESKQSAQKAAYLRELNRAKSKKEQNIELICQMRANGCGIWLTPKVQ